jgi:acetyltransferase-like isoleucine patch superfamily enzyme
MFYGAPSPLFRAQEGEIAIGDHCRLRGGPVRSRFSTGPGGRIVLGNRVGINYGAEIYSSDLITIGDNTILGGLVTIYDTSFHSVEESEEVKSAPVALGENVWIGRGVTIFAGVTIGDHSVVATGSIVTADIPPRVLAAGAPARPLRELRASDDWIRV